QLATRLVVLLVVFHVLLFFWPGSVSDIPMKANMLTKMLVSDYLLSGTIALAAVAFMVMAGIWRHKLPVRYEVWRASHILGALVIAIAGAHHVFSVGSYSRDNLLSAFWWALLLMALGALCYTYLLKPWLLARGAYRVESVRELGERIWEVVMQPARGRAITFDAGQFAWVNFRDPAIPLLDNPFSISSSPAELPQVRFLIKERGDTTARLGELLPGAIVYLDAPHGNFTLAGRHGEAIYLIAGGIGIAPVIGILRDLAAKQDKRPISLIYGARNPRQLTYADEIRQLQNVLDLKVLFSVDEPPPDWSGGVGEVDAPTIRRHLPAKANQCICLACGPTPMMLAIEQHLLAAGVPPPNIVYERFEYD
ncbi:MAG TPA: ferric reductase-like transmembrane domain-containing protein, partial [Burkholderiales bacterium]|nr:ferric reductase-like transmembrane domain-containing protein [Burkholderiales bacterium]